MGLGIQDVVVAVLVAAALGYLLWRRRRARQPKAGPLVTLGRAPKQGGGAAPPRPGRES